MQCSSRYLGRKAKTTGSAHNLFQRRHAALHPSPPIDRPRSKRRVYCEESHGFQYRLLLSTRPVSPRRVSLFQSSIPLAVVYRVRTGLVYRVRTGGVGRRRLPDRITYSEGGWARDGLNEIRRIRCKPSYTPSCVVSVCHIALSLTGRVGLAGGCL